MKFSIFFLLSLAIAGSSVWAQDSTNKETNLPPDPFSELGDEPEIPDYALEVDRNRGSFSVAAADGKYQPGSHFAHWFLETSAERWGNYFVALKYVSARPKLGVQIKIGDAAVLKGYAPRTGGPGKRGAMVLGTAYIPKKGDYPVTIMTGEVANDESFQVKAVEFTPAPENELLGQSIDGSIQLEAKTATTFSTNMRYEPDEKKNCLGFWTNVEDWAEWNFDVSSPGKFKVEIVQGCGADQGGSEVAVLVNDKTLKFSVEDTGGFQNWKTVDLGTVDLTHAGEHKLAVKPLSKAAKAVMDVQKVVLTPLAE